MGFVAYAGWLEPIQQLGQAMRDYKTPYGIQGRNFVLVSLLASIVLREHTACVGRLVGVHVDAWATVPSLKPKPGITEHPLHQIVRQLTTPEANEVQLVSSTAGQNTTTPRLIDPAHYTVTGTSSGLSPRHVLLVEDTWVSGAHSLSAAGAIRRAGVPYVSVLTIARWLKPGWECTSQEWATSNLAVPFDFDRCAWTGGACPTP